MKLNIVIVGFLMSLILGTFQANASSSGTILIVGNVPEECSIEVDHTEANFPLDITGGETATEVAQVTENYNAGGNYEIDIASVNGGLLNETATGPCSGAAANECVTYTVNYSGGSVGSAAIEATTTEYKGDTGTVAAGTSPGNSGEALTVTFAGLANGLAGLYLDELTLTIRAP